MYLQEIKIKTEKSVSVPENINHILVTDCSGSMSNELPKIRTQLKNKLPSLVKKGDTVSLIWFSSRSQSGKLAEKVSVDSAIDLKHLNDSIDRWLQPMGATGFVDPLKDVLSIANSSKGVYSLFFLTDGYDNCWSEKEILSATEALGGVLSNAVFVEYGWNANKSLLGKMAEKISGVNVFCESFSSYEPIIENAFKLNVGSKKVDIKVDNPVHDIVISITANGPCTYPVVNGVVSVPDTTDAIYYVNDSSTGLKNESALYQLAAVFASRMKPDAVEIVLSLLQDKKFSKKFQNAFGKQNISDFASLAIEASLDPAKRFEEGVGVTPVKENAFTIIDLLCLLSKDDKNLFYPSEMKYKRIARATEAADENALEFISTSTGTPISSLVWNESRPNVNISVTSYGYVNLPKHDFVKKKILNKKFDTKITRSYNIIRDGIANIELLPVSLTKEAFDDLVAYEVLTGEWKEGEVYHIDLRALPTINRKMRKSVSANHLFESQYNLFKLKSKQRVYNSFRDKWSPKEKFSKAEYPEDVSAWLAELGLTSSGFNPKRVTLPATDEYKALSLDISLKGFNTVAPIKDLESKLADGKSLTPSQEVLKETYVECLLKEASEDKVEWVIKKQEEVTAETRKLMKELACQKFAILIGQVWPKEFTSMDDSKMTLKFDGKDVLCELKQTEETIKI